jgi:cytochrome c oxidase subunit 4
MADGRSASCEFVRDRRTIATAWIALLLLMGASLGSAYLKLGPWNMVAGLVIAGIKAAIVAWLFMRLREAGTLVRLAAVAGLGAWCLLVTLSGVDYATRTPTPTPVQRPQQLLPVQAASEPR